MLAVGEESEKWYKTDGDVLLVGQQRVVIEDGALKLTK